MPIIQAETVNNTALVVPDLYVEIVPPQNLILNGVPSNIVGVVGTANWGPIGLPVIVASMADYHANFGPIIARKYDMATHVATAVQQGTQNFRCVRASDGTDTAAASNIPGTAVALTARYTGSLGNQITVAMEPGSKPATWRLSVAAGGMRSEFFDNLAGDPTSFWQTLANAVNTGTGARTGPSRLIKLQTNGNVSAPASFSVTLGTTTSGTDGASGVGSTQLAGQDGATRTGMYSLRGQGCALAVLADADDPSTWGAQAAFSQEEGIYFILIGPAGDSITNAVTIKQAAGLDCYSTKMMHGDWLWWGDQVNGLTRLVSPQGFIAGRLANLSPEQSALNKPIHGIIGSQRSGQPQSGEAAVYSSAELAVLFSAGIDVVSNPQPAGPFWGARAGRNASYDPARNGDNYARLTSYIARTLAAGMGRYVGQVINDTLFKNIRGTLLSFLQSMLDHGLLGITGGTLPYSVICDISNNPPARTGIGYVQADIQVRYQAINERFIVNLEGGQTVQVARQTLPD